MQQLTSVEMVKVARDLVKLLAERGRAVTLVDAFKVCRLGERTGSELRGESAAQARRERVRKGMVAGWCSDMRACGAWDGE